MQDMGETERADQAGNMGQISLHIYHQTDIRKGAKVNERKKAGLLPYKKNISGRDYSGKNNISYII